jgi:hypothetical protein
VNIVYTKVKEADCDLIGQRLYTNFWGRRYAGCTPLISRAGTLVDSGFSWSISYLRDEDLSRPSIQEPLTLDDTSQCSDATGKRACDEFHEGQRVSIKAIKSEHGLTVLKLEIASGR